jgi:hypothetical protein
MGGCGDRPVAGRNGPNSVSTIDFTGDDVAGAIREAEGRYRAESVPARFQPFDATSPSGLAQLLRGRGYKEIDPTSTMFKQIGHTPPADRVEISDLLPSAAWCDVNLDAITENRRVVNWLILERDVLRLPDW